MAHYAFLDENNLVIEVIAGIDETKLIEDQNPETWYSNFRQMKCKRTSYNGNIRGTYAGIGFTYNEEEDIFIAPQPYPSWIREGSFWNAPVPMPIEEGKSYKWDEPTISWVEVANV
jgi:hypothetical protein